MTPNTLEQLRESLSRAGGNAGKAWGAVSSGREVIDRILPAGGLRRGTLVEWLAAEPGSGAMTLALDAARSAAGDGRPIVVVDRRGWFYPPALSADWPLERLLVVRCRRDDEAFWACDQALRTSGVGAVLTQCDAVDERRLRCWQLAAEQSGAVGLVVRHMARQPEACFSDLRLLVVPSCAVGGRRVSLTLLRARQGRPGAMVEVSLDAHAHTLPPSTASFGRRIAGA